MSSVQCVDLRHFKKRYRLQWESNERDPWLLRIPCPKGHISPHGERTLAVYLERRPKSAARVIAEVPGARVHQRGDNEVSIVFDVEHLDAVAEIVNAKKRRIVSLTEEQKQTLVDRCKVMNEKRKDS